MNEVFFRPNVTASFEVNGLRVLNGKVDTDDNQVDGEFFVEIDSELRELDPNSVSVLAYPQYVEQKNIQPGDDHLAIWVKRVVVLEGAGNATDKIRVELAFRNGSFSRVRELALSCIYTSRAVTRLLRNSGKLIKLAGKADVLDKLADNADALNKLADNADKLLALVNAQN